MRYLILIFSLLIIGFYANGQEQHKLTIKISGIKKVKGKLGLCLITEPKEFLSSCSDYSEVPVGAQELTFSKAGVAEGTYAVTIYQDANSNGELDTNFFGIPKERYGFSNNPSSRFGPPGFKKCLFEVRSDTVIQIRLR